MKEVFKSAKLTIEYTYEPEAGEKAPTISEQSATLDIPQEHLVAVLDLLQEKGVFNGHLRGIAKELDFKRD
ncbi:hypothetical protein [Neobacillus kokaensis]|uniref:Uncharacterized protein n=1 Tax=Neobacillus kokaensis TaxID=2759023 RepID=A0ABQ3N6R7_9BACI|nr:hypothetical protein [Neobacillus kokaensis]GHH99751.1 hypothetical protein AM1BK_32940 [Neobacillus kokaensis]